MTDPERPSKNGYPLMTRADVARRLAADAPFTGQCVGILQHRFDNRATVPSPAGWMCSQVARGTALAARVAAGDVDERELLAAGATWLGAYSRQLSTVLRQTEIASRPDLAARAALFGVPVVPSAPVPVPRLTAAQWEERSFSRPDTREATVLPEVAVDAVSSTDAAEPLPAPAPAADERVRPTGFEATVLGLVEATVGGARLDWIVRQLGPSSKVTPALSALVEMGWLVKTGSGRWASYRTA